MKSSKAQSFGKFHKIPTIRFEDQKLTSFSGLLIFQALLSEEPTETMFLSSEDIAYLQTAFGGTATDCSSFAWLSPFAGN